MSLFGNAFELKGILQKAEPTKEDIKRVTKQCLENFATSFLQSRIIIHKSLIIPSIIRAAQVFAGLPESEWRFNVIVYRSTIKNLGNAINTWLNTWKYLNKNEVIEATKAGITEWIEELKKENGDLQVLSS
jgi:hypothetical protein